MGKQGPCCHCGITTTRLWRNGPPEKPVLCNACGSRWRTKGTLLDYTPLHARAPLLPPDKSEQFKASKDRDRNTGSNKTTKDPKLSRINETNADNDGGHDLHNTTDGNFHLGFSEEMIANRSSSGSAVSNSDGCYPHFAATNVSDGMPTPGVAPSRKMRIVIPCRKSTVVEELTRNLQSIMHQQSFGFNEEDDLLCLNEIPEGNVEICNGGVVIRQGGPPNLVITVDESEQCSLMVENNLKEDSWFSTSTSTSTSLKRSNGQNLELQDVDRHRKMTKNEAVDDRVSSRPPNSNSPDDNLLLEETKMIHNSGSHPSDRSCILDDPNRLTDDDKSPEQDSLLSNNVQNQKAKPPISCSAEWGFM